MESYVVRCSLLAVLSILAASCRTPDGDDAAPKAEFGPEGVPIDWGTLQPSPENPQTAEAKLANAAARRLNEAARLPELLSGLADTPIVDGIVSLPVHLLANDDDHHNHPFGDGQLNASLTWRGWPADSLEVPVAMTLAKVADGNGRWLILEPAVRMIESTLGSTPASIEAHLSDDSGQSMVASLVIDEARAVYRGVIGLDADVRGVSGSEGYPASVSAGAPWLGSLKDPWAWPRVKVSFTTEGAVQDDGRAWPVLFRFPAQTAVEAQASLPSDGSVFPDGRAISLPPYSGDSEQAAFERLRAWYDAQPEGGGRLADFYPAVGDSGVHHRFTDGTGHVAQTATGGVDTYVLKASVGRTQVLYTCFDARNPAFEAQWGVPSGAGWHSIGHELHGQSQDNWTFAETVVNGFESSGIFAGWGVRTPYPFAGEAPYEAKDVTTFRVLRAGEAFTTAKGHFHWYAIDASHKACAIVWKHLGCGLRSDRDLSCP